MSQTTAPAKSEYDDILAQRKKIKRQEERKRNIPLYLMMLPGLLYLIANIADKLRPLKYITPFGYAESGYIVANRAIHAGYLAVGLAITAVCIVLAFVRFCRKDFLS